MPDLGYPIAAASGIHAYDYIIYIESGVYKARDCRTGINLGTTSTTDVGVVINACINLIQPSSSPIAVDKSGSIFINPGTYKVATSILVKNNIALIGSGVGQTTLQQAASSNIDLIKSFGFNDATYGTGTNSNMGTINVIIKDLSLNGAYWDSNGTAGCGIRKYGFSWLVQNVNIYDIFEYGIYTEWSVNGAHGYGDEDVRLNTEIWDNVTIFKCFSGGILHRGPHDSVARQLMIVGCYNFAIKIEYLANTYSGEMHLATCHIWDVNGTGPKGIWVAGGKLHFHDCIVETLGDPNKSAGTIGLYAQGGVARGDYLWVFRAETGVKVENPGPCQLRGLFLEDNNIGLEVLGNEHEISGILRNNHDDANTVGYGVLFGSASVSSSNNRLELDISGSKTAHMKWNHASSVNNMIKGVWTTVTGDTALVETATPSPTNSFELMQSGAGTLTTRGLSNTKIDYSINTMKNSTGYQYIVYIDANDSNLVKARNTATGVIDSSNSDAATVIQYAITNAGTGGVFIKRGLYQLASSLTTLSGTHIEGEGSQNTQLRPTGNIPAIIISANTHNMKLNDIFFTHAQVGYTSSLIQFREGSSAAYLSNLSFYDFDNYVGSCIEFYNNAAAAAGAGIYDHFISNCTSNGFAQTFLVTIPNSTNWVNGIHIDNGWFDGSKYFIKSNAVGATTNVDGWQISDSDWQYETYNVTPSNEAAIMFDDTATHNYTKFNGLMIWDLPADRNLLNTNVNADYYLNGVVPDTKIAGSGFATLDANGNIKKDYSRNATETITNKTISAKSNSLLRVVQAPHTKRTGMWTSAAGTTLTTASNVSGILAQHVITGGGTVSNTFDTTEGVLINIASTATTGNAAGIISPTGGVGVGRRLFAMRASVRAKIDSTANSKFLFGFTSNSTLPIAAATQPLAVGDHGIIVGFVETGTGNTNYTVWHNNGSTPVAADNITGTIAKNTNFHTIEIYWSDGGNPHVVFDGTDQEITTDLPATNQNLFFNCVAVTTTSGAKTISTSGVWIETGPQAAN